MKLIESIKQAYLHILPPALFFLIAFGLLFATQQLISREYGVTMPGFGVAVVGALLVGKVLLILDKLPLIDKFPDKPLIYNIVWKSGIYFLASLLVRCLKEVVPLLLQHKNWASAWAQYVNTSVWPEFWLIQMWLAVLFLVYCSLRELVRVLGRDRLVRLFFIGRQ